MIVMLSGVEASFFNMQKFYIDILFNYFKISFRNISV